MFKFLKKLLELQGLLGPPPPPQGHVGAVVSTGAQAQENHYNAYSAGVMHAAAHMLSTCIAQHQRHLQNTGAACGSSGPTPSEALASFLASIAAQNKPAATPQPFVPVLSGERVLLSYPHAKKKQRFLELLCSETRFRQFPVEKTPTNSPEQKPKKQNKNSPKAKSKNKTLIQ